MTVPAPLTPAQRDDLRVETAKAADQLLDHARRKYGDSPEVMATAIEGVLTGVTFAAWKARTDAMNLRKLRRILRALLDRAVQTVKGRPQ